MTRLSWPTPRAVMNIKPRLLGGGGGNALRLLEPRGRKSVCRHSIGVVLRYKYMCPIDPVDGQKKVGGLQMEQEINSCIALCERKHEGWGDAVLRLPRAWVASRYS